MAYGGELILDLYDCDTSKFNREDLEIYLTKLCELIDMEREDLYWWDYEDNEEAYNAAPVHLKGTSCVQFITTSTVVIHTLNELKEAYINIFSCKKINVEDGIEFTAEFFGTDKYEAYFLDRGNDSNAGV